MKIAFRTSSSTKSSGRGNYEVAFEEDQLAISDVDGRELVYRIPGRKDIVSGLEIRKESGKPRLKIRGSGPVQFGRQIAAVMLMPSPRRDTQGLKTSPTVMGHKIYFLDEASVTASKVSGNSFEVTLNQVKISNNSGERTLSLAARQDRIDNIRAQTDLFPSPLADAIARHMEICQGQGPIKADAEKAATRILVEAVNVLGMDDWKAPLDPLDLLEEILDGQGGGLAVYQTVSTEPENGQSTSETDDHVLPPAEPSPPPAGNGDGEPGARGTDGAGAGLKKSGGSPRTGQGYGPNPHRQEIEAYGMTVAREYYEGRGWVVTDVSTPPKAKAAGVGSNPNYDYLCTKENGPELHVEVKASRAHVRKILATDGEVRHGAQCANARIFLVEEIIVQDPPAEGKVKLGGGRFFETEWPTHPSVTKLADKLVNQGLRPMQYEVAITDKDRLSLLS